MKRCFQQGLGIVSVCLLISACGGGGGAAAPTPLATAPVVTPPTPDPTGGSPPGSGTPDPVEPPVAGFAPSANYRHFCENPRDGVNASNNTPWPDQPGATVDENNWLRSWSNELYLWYDEIEDVDPETMGTADYFDLMRTFALTPSGAPRDKFHFSLDTDDWQARSQSGVSAGYGATFAVLSSSAPRQVVVAYTEPNAPATALDVLLKRGTTILEVDGVDVINGSGQAAIDTLNRGLFPRVLDETHVFLVQDVGGEAREVSMTSTSVMSDPVQNVKTIDTSTGRVGYLTFNDFIATSESELFDAISLLQAADIDDLVLDLRYNGGGFLDIASELAYMIAGSITNGKTFEELEFNDKHPIFNPVTGRVLSPSIFYSTARGFSVNTGTTLPTLSLSRVFVITGPGTCSASESVMNSLRGVDVDVIQIGATTCGKPYGFYAFDNCGTTYFSVQFRGINAKGFGDYTDGFSPAGLPQIEGTEVPGCGVSDDLTKSLGDPEEARLAAALQYRVDGTCPESTAGLARAAILPAADLSAVDGEVIKPFWLKNRILRDVDAY